MATLSTLEITLVSVENHLFNVAEASMLTGFHPGQIEEFEKGGLVRRAGSDPSGRPLFDEAGLCRLRLLSGLRQREKMSLRMTRLFCQLLDRLEQAEAEVRSLRERD